MVSHLELVTDAFCPCSFLEWRGLPRRELANGFPSVMEGRVRQSQDSDGDFGSGGGKGDLGGGYVSLLPLPSSSFVMNSASQGASFLDSVLGEGMNLGLISLLALEASRT